MLWREDLFRLETPEGVLRDTVPDGVAAVSRIPFMCVSQVVDGWMIYRSRGREVRIDPGESLLSGANQRREVIHRNHGGRPAVVSWVHLRCHFSDVADVSELVDLPLKLEASHAARVTELLSALLSKEHEAPDQVTNLSRQMRRIAAVYELLALAYEGAEAGPAFLAMVENDERLLAVLGYVHENLQTGFRVEDLARVAGMSATGFHRFFLRSLGTTPGRYVTRLRLSRASRLLGTTTSPVYRIADEVGFGSPFHFSRAFHRMYGLTPSEYRERVQLDWPSSQV
jgi:AraC-like DNA-binding protein